MRQVMRLVPVVWLAILAAAVQAADWSQFRGPNCSGTASGRALLPTEIGPTTNVVWKTALPPGHSSPVVVGDRIFVTAVRDQKLLTIALDRATGKILWEVTPPTKNLENIHKIGSLAQASPTADEELLPYPPRRHQSISQLPCGGRVFAGLPRHCSSRA